MRRSWQLRYDESGVETFSQLKSIACILSDKLLPHSDLIFELFKNHRIELIVRRFGDSFNVDMILDETTAVIFIPIKMIDRLSADYVQFHLGRQYSKVYVIVELFVAEKILYPFNRPGLYAVGQWLGSIKKFSPCSIVTIYSKSAQHSAMIIRSLIDGIGQDKPPVWWNRRWLLRNETVQERFLWMLGSFNPHTAHLCLSRVNLRKLILESEINIKNNSSVFSSFKRAIESELR
jgi:hypothetical protein